MSIQGSLTKLDDDTFAGTIYSLSFDLDITLVDNPYKSKDSHPDYAINGKSPRGKSLRVGSAWNAIGQTSGKPYLSLSIDLGTGTTIRANAFPATGEDANDGDYFISSLAG